jgi:hypothetical protein
LPSDKQEGKIQFGKPQHVQEDYNEIESTETDWKGVKWIAGQCWLCQLQDSVGFGNYRTVLASAIFCIS